ITRIEGPARLMVLHEPINRPVPMAPPMAISCRCRLDKLRCNSPCSADELLYFSDIIDSNFEFYPRQINVKKPEYKKKNHIICIFCLNCKVHLFFLYLTRASLTLIFSTPEIQETSCQSSKTM